MNEKLNNLNNRNFSAYAINVIPGTINNMSIEKGALTIVDNSDGSIDSLVAGTQNLFVDDLFIASGYGFSSYNDYKNATNSIYTEIPSQINGLEERIDAVELSQTKIIYNVDSENSKKTNEFKNSYGFTTSYNYLDLAKSPDTNEYTLSITTHQANSISNIMVTPQNASPHQEYAINNDISGNVVVPESFIMDVEITKGSSGDPLYEASSVKVKVNGEQINSLNQEVSIPKPNGKYSEDLKVECFFNDDLVYSYIAPSFLKWKDSIYVFPIESDNENMEMYEPMNKMNFRNSTFEFNNQEAATKNAFSEMMESRIDNNIGYKLVDPDNPNKISFNSGVVPSYDYIILVESNYSNVEFYFNGMKSKNWAMKQYTMNNKTYDVWQSPQKYIGNHEWEIKITSR